MRSALLVLISLFFLISCRDQTPDGILSENKMQKLLLDVHVLDGNIANMPLDSSRPKIDSYYEELFRYHGIDSTQFLNSLNYYTARPLTLKNIYEKINVELQNYLLAEQERYRVEYEKQKIQDSIVHAQHRDSLERLARIETKSRLLRDILYVHSKDTTKDEPIPFTFSRFGKYIFNDIGLGEISYSLPDSLYDLRIKNILKPIQNDLWKNTTDPELKPVNFEEIPDPDSQDPNRASRRVVDPNAKNPNILNRPQTQY